jgi:hypothetical protein
MRRTKRPWHEQDEFWETCGFQDVAVYGSPSGAPYDEKAERLIIVGRTRP